MSWTSKTWGNDEPSMQTRSSPASWITNLGSAWDKRNNFKNFASYDAKQCDWIESGVGSIKRPTKGQGRLKQDDLTRRFGSLGCDLRIRSHESWNQKFRVLGKDEEVQCFAKSEELAVKVVAINKEFRRHC
jgi:hypothetical protein